MLLNLIDSCKRRLLGYEKHTVIRLSTLLDPRFKKEGFLFSHNVSESVKALETELTQHNKNPAVYKSEPPTPTETATPNQQLFAFLKSNIAKKPRAERVDAILSLRNFYESPNLDQDSNPLDYWKNMNGNDALKACCKKLLCIPAT
ncbi:uncharacterized protein LOC128860426 [Anastrepha ludens]|uniref:uncharacterized protein LOC128860426 n=1 Tax=Anastrepha ludens TaxID=28586 RepID=UPI0023AF8681|nr:uncharacterized protein LOC128860426 [Anastrepha ludens]